MICLILYKVKQKKHVFVSFLPCSVHACAVAALSNVFIFKGSDTVPLKYSFPACMSLVRASKHAGLLPLNSCLPCLQYPLQTLQHCSKRSVHDTIPVQCSVQ